MSSKSSWAIRDIVSHGRHESWSILFSPLRISWTVRKCAALVFIFLICRHWSGFHS